MYDLNQTGEAPEYIYSLHVLTFLKENVTDYVSLLNYPDIVNDT